MADKIYYKGYSSAAYMETGSLTVRDLQLVKLDIVTHIFTRKGSRVKMADYGTRIPDMPFELITEELLDELYGELETVFQYDPRIELLQLTVTPYYDLNTIMAAAVLKYIEFDVVDVLHLEFNDTTVR